MTKVCIIAPANLKYIPFAEYYIEYLKKANIEFDVISWDKAGIDEGVKYRFNYIVNDLKRAKMLFGYLRFTRYCKKIIKREKYTKLIFLTIAPLFFCGMRLSKRYRKNYILDIRDASIDLVCRRLKMERITSHAFRDTFATRAIESGMNPKTLQSILGHASIKMTMDLYAHVMEDTKIEEMQKVSVM